MEQQAAQRKNKSKELKEKDFYQTPKECVMALMDFIKDLTNVDSDLSVLDPCCGFGNISDELEKYFKDVDIMDLFVDSIVEEKEDFLSCDSEYDLIVMNPPYSNKYNFIDHARKIAHDVFVFLPLQVMNYNMFHEKYLNTNNFKGKLILTPKILLNQKGEIRYGGISSYAWFWWQKGYNNYGESREWYKNIKDFL